MKKGHDNDSEWVEYTSEHYDALNRSRVLLRELESMIAKAEASYKVPTHSDKSLDQPSKPMSFKERYNAELAEFLGTMVFLFCGYASNAQMNVGREYNRGNWVTMVFGWGIGLTLGICIAGNYSGAHLNPIVSLQFCIMRGFPFLKMLRYWLAQFMGAMFASAWSFILYYPPLRQLDPHDWDLSSGGSFYGTLQPNEPVGSCWFNEVTGTAILVATIFSVCDERNKGVTMGFKAWIFGMAVLCLGCTTGFYTVFAMNPFRDFCPRIIMSMMGFPHTIWTHDKLWWLVGGITAPITGSILGACCYDLFVYMPPSMDEYAPYKRWRNLKIWWHQRRVKTVVSDGQSSVSV